MAQSDGSDLHPTHRQRLRETQLELWAEYRSSLPPGTLLFRCERCTWVYPLNHFPRNHQRRYGVRPICRACLRDSRPRERHDPDPEVTEKTCPLCRTRRPITAFWIDRSQADGYSPWCRPCTQARREGRAAGRHYDDVTTRRREETLRLCAELGIDYPDHDILRCRYCGEVKPVSEFVNDWRYATRKRTVCLHCHTTANNPERKP